MPNIDINFLPHQKQLFLSTARFKVMRCGRGAGKSFYMHSNAIIDMAQGKRVIMTAQTNDILSTKFIPELLELGKGWGLNIGWDKKHNILSLGKGICWTASYENDNFEKRLTGATKVASGYYDEIARCKNYNKFLACIKPCFRASGFTPSHTAATTPKKGSEFDRWLKNNNNVYVISGATIDDNTHVSEEEREEMKEGLSGDYFRQEILGESIDGDIEFALFPQRLLRKVCKGQRGVRSLGIDCAGSGRDNNVFVVSDDFGILEIVKVQVADTFQMASIARQLIEKWSVSVVNIDDTGGFGKGLYDMLKIQYNFINAINFGMAAEDSDRFANARAEFYTQLADDCEGGFSIQEEEAIEELELVSFDTTNTGRRILVPKETIKKVLGRSPDVSDALALSRYKRKSAIIAPPENVDAGELSELMSGW